VVATCYLPGVSTRRLERLAEALGITSLSKSSRSFEMAKELGWCRFSPFATEPWTWAPTGLSFADALLVKVREEGRTVGVHVLLATEVNAKGPPGDPSV